MVSVDYEACDLGSIPSSGGIIDLLFSANAGQVGLGSSRPESSRPGSTQIGHLPWSYIAYYFNYKKAGTILFMCFIKMFNKSLR